MADDKKHTEGCVKRRILVKVRALFSRAGREDTPIEEARTSALLGARLFVKHALGLSSDVELEFDRDEPISEPTEASGDGYDWTDWRKSSVAEEESPRARYDRHGPIPAPRSAPPPKHARARKKTPRASKSEKASRAAAPKKTVSKSRSPRAAAAQEILRAWAANGWKASGPNASARASTYILITSDYAGRCVSCSEGYVPGEALAWRPRKGATHYGCRAFWDSVAWESDVVDDPFA